VQTTTSAGTGILRCSWATTHDQIVGRSVAFAVFTASPRYFGFMGRLDAEGTCARMRLPRSDAAKVVYAKQRNAEYEIPVFFISARTSHTWRIFNTNSRHGELNCPVMRLSAENM